MARMKKNLIVRLIIGIILGIVFALIMEKEQLQEMGSSMHSLAYVLGIISGVLCGLALVAFIMWLVKKMGGKVDLEHRNAYDERQLVVRGKAYKAAYLTLTAYMIIFAILDDLMEIMLFMSVGGIWLGICLSILVFAVICIVEDAYMSLYENAKGIILLLSFVAIVNLVVGCINLWHGLPLVTDGGLSVTTVNLMMGLLYLVISIVLCGKIIYNKKHPEEDEE